MIQQPEKHAAAPGVAGEVRDFYDRYVPIRMPDTICVEDRLPAGAAAVLINRNHTYRDLFLPIDSVEKRWFDAIGGNCSIGDIVEKALPSSQSEPPLDRARAFFHRLWLHDQVVFETLA